MNPKAKHGRSKQKRSDCRLVTLGLVLDGDCFPLHSRVFEGNASEPETLETMLNELDGEGLSGDASPIVVMDAGIASEDNVEWLKSQGHRYIVVSREQRKEHPQDDERTVLVRDDNKNKLTIDDGGNFYN